jgi:hypothetical protein
METVALFVCFLIGLVFVFAFTPEFLKSLRANKWNKVEATIIQAGYDTIHPRDSPRMNYRPWVIYEYVVNQTRCRSNRVNLSRSDYYDKADADNHVRRNPAGTPLDIWVDPKNYRDTVLTPGFNWGYFFAVIFGCAALGFSSYKAFV